MLLLYETLLWLLLTDSCAQTTNNVMCFPLVKPRSADFSRYSGDRFRGKCVVMRTVQSQQNSTELLFIILHLKIKNDKKNIRYKEQKVGIN